MQNNSYFYIFYFQKQFIKKLNEKCWIMDFFKQNVIDAYQILLRNQD